MTEASSSGGVTRLTDISGTFLPPRLLIGEPLPVDAVLEALGELAAIPEQVASIERVGLPPNLLGVLLLSPALVKRAPLADWAEKLRAFPRLAVIAVGEAEEFDSSSLEGLITGAIPWPASGALLRRAIRSALSIVAERVKLLRAEELLARGSHEREELNSIGIALSTERDPERLLQLILTKAREMAGSDAGSLYLVEGADAAPVSEDETAPGQMRFVLAQNDSVTVPFAATTIPLSPRTIAGYVALTGQTLVLDDVYWIPKTAPYSFNSEFDQRIGYRTKSMLVVPMKDHRGRVMGVLQLINRKKRSGTKLTPDNVDRRVIAFDDRDIQLSRSLASQAAVAIDNNQLIASIQRLFEGFVTASVMAIEQRDPTTSGHSGRVSILTCGLAEVIEKCEEPRFRDTRFTYEQMREIRYASLLHDFGKVGVREAVLVKAKKLYPHELEIIRERFEYLRRTVENQVLREKLVVTLGGSPEMGRDEALRLLERKLEKEWNELGRMLDIVLRSNEPTILPDGNFEVLQELAKRTIETTRGEVFPLLTPEEVRVLSIRKGSLDERERLEIESHVTQTFAFLSKIPWTPELGRVPDIAYAHHEKLNGRGYPRRLTAAEIPLPSRLMTVADIFDALTASDRPYKKAIPMDRALDILSAEVKDGLLDEDLVRLFVEGKVYEKTATHSA